MKKDRYFSTSVRVGRCAETLRYFRTVIQDIDNEKDVFELKGYLVYTGEHGVQWEFDEFDSISQSTYDLFTAFFEPGDDTGLRDGVEIPWMEDWWEVDSFILIENAKRLQPYAKGYKLMEQAVEETLVLLNVDLALFQACNPCGNKKGSTKKLCKYYESLEGFTHLNAKDIELFAVKGQTRRMI
jgi:hypothetical protein